MATPVDLMLPSCPAIPDSMWIAASATLDLIIQKCWLLLGAFVAIKMLTDAFSDMDAGRVALHTHIKTLFQAFLIVLLLTYYKKFLMVFDHLIDSLCIHAEGFEIALAKMQDLGNKPDQDAVPSGLPSIVTVFKFFFAGLFKSLAIFTHGGAVIFMRYVRVVSLLIMMQFGPLAALFSLLPGPFRRSFSIWSRGYVNITCWAITLNILWVFAKTFSGISWMQSVTEGFGVETLAHTLLSLILLVAIFLTPAWTSKFVSSATLPNLSAGLGMLAGKGIRVGKVVHKSLKIPRSTG